MRKFILTMLGACVFWAVLIAWAVSYAFADRSYAGNVSGILLSPCLFLRIPVPTLYLAYAFWVLVSALACLRGYGPSKHLALAMLGAHWIGALLMLLRDMSDPPDASRMIAAMWSYPSLSFFLVLYVSSQIVLCRWLCFGRLGRAA